MARRRPEPDLDQDFESALTPHPCLRRYGSQAEDDVTAASVHLFAGASWNAPAVDRSSADQPKSPATDEFDGYQKVGAALAEVKNTERLECSASACTTTPRAQPLPAACAGPGFLLPSWSRFWSRCWNHLRLDRLAQLALDGAMGWNGSTRLPRHARPAYKIGLPNHAAGQGAAWGHP